MNLEIIKEIDRKLLSRKEITARISYENVTPTRSALSKSMAQKFGVSEEVINILKIDNIAGHREAFVSAYIYDDKKFLVRLTKKGKKEIEKEQKILEAKKKAEEEKKAKTEKTEAGE